MTFRKFGPFHTTSEWSFIDPDTGQEFHAKDKGALIQRVLAYRRQNGLPEIFELGAVIENHVCGKPENLGKCVKNPDLSRSWWTSLKGGVALLVNMLIENPVAKEVADARGKVCVGCPHNVFPDKTRFIKWSDRVAEASAPGKRSEYHNQLGNCDVCTCPLRAKVWMPGPFPLSKEEKSKMREVGCWQILKDE